MSKTIIGLAAAIILSAPFGVSPSLALAQEKAPDQVDRCLDRAKDTLLISVKVFEGNALVVSPRILATYGLPSSATFNDLWPG